MSPYLSTIFIPQIWKHCAMNGVTKIQALSFPSKNCGGLFYFRKGRYGMVKDLFIIILLICI